MAGYKTIGDVIPKEDAEGLLQAWLAMPYYAEDLEREGYYKTLAVSREAGVPPFVAAADTLTLGYFYRGSVERAVESARHFHIPWCGK